MTQLEILTLAADADTYDAVVILWVTANGTQPVLFPRSLGDTAARASARWSMRMTTRALRGPAPEPPPVRRRTAA